MSNTPIQHNQAGPTQPTGAGQQTSNKTQPQKSSQTRRHTRPTEDSTWIDKQNKLTITQGSIEMLVLLKNYWQYKAANQTTVEHLT